MEGQGKPVGNKQAEVTELRRLLGTRRGHRDPGGHWTQAEATGIQEEAGPVCHYLLGPARSSKRNERGGRAVGEAFAGPDLTDHELDGQSPWDNSHVALSLSLHPQPQAS